MALALVAPLLLFCLNAALAAQQHIVGDNAGWGLNVNYTDWVVKNQFHVGDALVFKYHSDSVLEVNRDGFNSCISSTPINHHSDGNTVIRLSRPGLHWFISGEKNHCQQGQKFGIMVAPASSNTPPASGPISGPTVPSTPSPAAAPGPKGHHSRGGRHGSAAFAPEQSISAPAHPPTSGSSRLSFSCFWFFCLAAFAGARIL